MREKIKEYLLSQKIEYFSILSYEDCVEINQGLRLRCGFEPKSVITYLIPYYSGRAENLSIYSASLDYHIIISQINSGLIALLRDSFPGSSVLGYGDHSPINERHAALISGLGIAGDNGLIINERYGSYVFIADVISDIDPTLLSCDTPITPKRCEGCGACKAACPTGILRCEGEDCLSAITQRKGELSAEEISLMREYNTLWGCDICQYVCPHNIDPIPTPLEFFYNDRIPHLTHDILSTMSEEEFKARAFAWRKRATIERNLDILYGKK